MTGSSLPPARSCREFHSVSVAFVFFGSGRSAYRDCERAGVNAEAVAAFAATHRSRTHARVASSPASRGFDVLQQRDEPTRFRLLFEVYTTRKPPSPTRTTAHYFTWRDTVAPPADVGGNRVLGVIHHEMSLPDRGRLVDGRAVRLRDRHRRSCLAVAPGRQSVSGHNPWAPARSLSPAGSDAPSVDVIAADQRHWRSGIALAREGEPTITVARAAVDAARQHDADVVVACGGGSAIDLGKAVAALLANAGRPARLPRSGRPRAGHRRAVASVHRCADNGRDGR